jgi:hypothetical protein
MFALSKICQAVRRSIEKDEELADALQLNVDETASETPAAPTLPRDFLGIFP